MRISRLVGKGIWGKTIRITEQQPEASLARSKKIRNKRPLTQGRWAKLGSLNGLIPRSPPMSQQGEGTKWISVGSIQSPFCLSVTVIVNGHVHIYTTIHTCTYTHIHIYILKYSKRGYTTYTLINISPLH